MWPVPELPPRLTAARDDKCASDSDGPDREPAQENLNLRIKGQKSGQSLWVSLVQREQRCSPGWKRR